MNDGIIPTQCAWCTRLYALDAKDSHLLLVEREDGTMQPVALDEATSTMCDGCQARVLAVRDYKRALRDSDKYVAIKIVKEDSHAITHTE